MITVKKIKNAPSHWVYKQKKKNRNWHSSRTLQSLKNFKSILARKKVNSAKRCGLCFLFIVSLVYESFSVSNFNWNLLQLNGYKYG